MKGESWMTKVFSAELLHTPLEMAFLFLAGKWVQKREGRRGGRKIGAHPQWVAFLPWISRTRLLLRNTLRVQFGVSWPNSKSVPLLLHSQHIEVLVVGEVRNSAHLPLPRIGSCSSALLCSARNLPHSQMDDNEFEPGNRFSPLRKRGFHLLPFLFAISSIQVKIHLRLFYGFPIRRVERST